MNSCRYNAEAYQVPPTGYEAEKSEGDICKHLLRNNTIDAPTILIQKTLFNELNDFDTSYESLEDWDFVIRASKTGRISYVNEALVDVYPGSNRLSLSTAAYYGSRCRMIADHMEDLQDYGIFDLVISDLFKIAEEKGTLSSVKKLLMLSLSQKTGVL